MVEHVSIDEPVAVVDRAARKMWLVYWDDAGIYHVSVKWSVVIEVAVHHDVYDVSLGPF